MLAIILNSIDSDGIALDSRPAQLLVLRVQDATIRFIDLIELLQVCGKDWLDDRLFNVMKIEQIFLTQEKLFQVLWLNQSERLKQICSGLYFV